MDDIFKSNAYRVLERFMDSPAEDFSARGLGRSLEMSHATVLKYLKELESLDLVRKNTRTLYPTYRANTESEKYRRYRRNRAGFHVIGSGLVEHIWKETYASSIVLFGSMARGTHTDESDIDIFVEAEERKIEVGPYEKNLERPIHLLFGSIRNLSGELRDNIINGVVLRGFLKCEAGRNASKQER